MTTLSLSLEDSSVQQTSQSAGFGKVAFAAATLVSGFVFPTASGATQPNSTLWQQLKGRSAIAHPRDLGGCASPIASDIDGMKLLEIAFTQTPVELNLDRLRLFQTWGANWDAEGASAPNIEALEVAQDLLSLLPNSDGKTALKVTMDPEGLPFFFLTREHDSGEISINEDFTIDYFFDLEDGTIVSCGFGLPFDRRSLPEELNAFLAGAV
jgi:hypothetical protein